MRVRLKRVELTATAVRSFSGPTRALMKTDQTGQAKASKTPASSASTTIIGIDAMPSQVATASGAAVQTDPHCVGINIRLRPTRSGGGRAQRGKADLPQPAADRARRLRRRAAPGAAAGRYRVQGQRLVHHR